MKGWLVTRDLPTSLLMFIAARSASARIFDAVRAAGFEDLTDAQGRLLMNLDPDGTRLSVLAERAQIAKQTATALVDKLERAGYVERVPDPTDGRARLVRATARAHSVVPAAHSAEAEIEAEWTAYLGAKRMRELRSTLADLRAIADPWV